MNFLELTKKRFSVRNYKSDRVEQDKIDYIIECARLAPSAVNYQPWHFMVVVSEEQKQYLQPIITQYFIDNKSEIWLLFLIAHSKR